MNDRQIIHNIIQKTGLKPLTPMNKDYENSYTLHYRKSQKEGERFILNIRSITDELREALKNAPITSRLVIKE